MRRIRRFAVAAVLLVSALAAGGSASARPLATAPPPPTLSVSPTSASHVVGQSHTLTAKLTNSQTGGALQDYQINFSITSGPNTGMSGSGVTDSSGNATYTYSSTKTGTDTITVSVVQASTPPQTATVTWTAPVVIRTDVSVTLTAPSFARVGGGATFTARVANGGPDPATGVELRANVPAGATLVSASSTVGACSATSPLVCTVGTLANGASATVTIQLSQATPGSISLGATVQGDYDTNGANNSAAATAPVLEPNAVPPAPPASSAPGTYNALGTGTISVNGTVKPGDQQFVLNAGDVVDVSNGIITFTDSNGVSGSWAKVRFTVARRTSHLVAPTLGIARTADDGVASQFQVQQAAGGGLTTLTLVGGDFSICKSPRSVAAKNRKPVRQLWGSAKGAFTTKGRFAAATVRGTFWFVQDRCDGTLTQVVEGTVDVLDSTRSKTVSVSAGNSYLAAPRPALKAPTQTPGQVKKRGLRYAGKTYKTKPTFTRYLKVVGYSWRDFSKKYPKLAKALASRRLKKT